MYSRTACRATSCIDRDSRSARRRNASASESERRSVIAILLMVSLAIPPHRVLELIYTLRLWVIETHLGTFVEDCGLAMQDVEGEPLVEAGWLVRGRHVPAVRAEDPPGQRIPHSTT